MSPAGLHAVRSLQCNSDRGLLMWQFRAFRDSAPRDRSRQSDFHCVLLVKAVTESAHIQGQGTEKHLPVTEMAAFKAI